MSVGNAMRRMIPAGSYLLFLLFLAGIWVAIAPFVMTTQPSGQRWATTTVNDVVIGAVLMAVALFGILGYLLFALRDLLHEAQANQELAEQRSQAPVEQ